MHRILGVVAMLGTALACSGRVAIAHQAAALSIEVAEKRGGGSPAEERGGESLELVAEFRAHEQLLRRHEQQQQCRRASLQREPAVLAQPVDREIEIARSALDPFRLAAIDEVLELAQA